jgi:hypothetical protein
MLRLAFNELYTCSRSKRIFCSFFHRAISFDLFQFCGMFLSVGVALLLIFGFDIVGSDKYRLALGKPSTRMNRIRSDNSNKTRIDCVYFVGNILLE